MRAPRGRARVVVQQYSRASSTGREASDTGHVCAANGADAEPAGHPPPAAAPAFAPPLPAHHGVLGGVGVHNVHEHHQAQPARTRRRRKARSVNSSSSRWQLNTQRAPRRPSRTQSGGREGEV